VQNNVINTFCETGPPRPHSKPHNSPLRPHSKPTTQTPNPETRNSKSETPIPKPKTEKPEPSSPNLKPEAPTHKPRTLKAPSLGSLFEGGACGVTARNGDRIHVSILDCKQFPNLHLRVGGIPHGVRPPYAAQWRDPNAVIDSALGGVPREQKILKGHLPRVIYHRAYLSIQKNDGGKWLDRGDDRWTARTRISSSSHLSYSRA